MIGESFEYSPSDGLLLQAGATTNGTARRRVARRRRGFTPVRIATSAPREKSRNNGPCPRRHLSALSRTKRWFRPTSHATVPTSPTFYFSTKAWVIRSRRNCRDSPFSRSSAFTQLFAPLHHDALDADAAHGGFAGAVVVQSSGPTLRTTPLRAPAAPPGAHAAAPGRRTRQATRCVPGAAAATWPRAPPGPCRARSRAWR